MAKLHAPLPITQRMNLLEYYTTHGTWHNDGQFKWWTSFYTDLNKGK